MGERRHFSPQFKAERVLELLNGTHTPAEVCRTHGIKPALLLAWRKRLVEHAPKLFERDSDREPTQARLAELERLVGRLTLELDVAKKASSLWQTPRRGSGSW
jgi:transposase-like protein